MRSIELNMDLNSRLTVKWIVGCTRADCQVSNHYRRVAGFMPGPTFSRPARATNSSIQP